MLVSYTCDEVGIRFVLVNMCQCDLPQAVMNNGFEVLLTGNGIDNICDGFVVKTALFFLFKCGF